MQLQPTPINPQETAHENVVPDLPWSKPRFWRIRDADTKSGKNPFNPEGGPSSAYGTTPS